MRITMPHSFSFFLFLSTSLSFCNTHTTPITPTFHWMGMSVSLWLHVYRCLIWLCVVSYFCISFWASFRMIPGLDLNLFGFGCVQYLSSISFIPSFLCTHFLYVHMFLSICVTLSITVRVVHFPSVHTCMCVSVVFPLCVVYMCVVGCCMQVLLGEVHSGLSSTQVVVKELKSSASVQDQMHFLEEARPYR